MRFTHSIGNHYIVRTLTICLSVLCFFLALFAAVQNIKTQNRFRLHFEALQKTLTPALIAAAESQRRPEIRALFKGLLDGQGLAGIRLMEKTAGWQESVFRSETNPLPGAQNFRFFIHATFADGRNHDMSVEIFTHSDLLEKRDTEYLAIVLCLGATCFVLLVVLLTFHVRSSLVQPIQDLQERLAELKPAELLDSEILVTARSHVTNEIEALESNFLVLLRQLQLKHREGLSAKNSLAFLSQNMASELNLRKRKLEDELARSMNDSKLAALGDMAAGIAHEINNPLAILVARTTQLHMIARKAPEIEAQISSIVDSMEAVIFRIQESITDLETISSQPSLEEPKPIRLQRVLQRLYDLAINRFGPRGIRFELKVDIEAEVKGREVEFTQALLYLIENAAEAAVSAGRPWIRLELDATDAQNVTILLVDSGNGIEVGLRDKIFQPFFTTKEVGKGRGIGLSLAQSIVLAHGGRLFFNYHAEHTTLCITLPRHIAVLKSA